MTQTDAYDALGLALARAAERLDAEPRRNHARRLRRWSSRHLLATVLIAGTATASATAGVVAALRTTTSPGGSGPIAVATTPGGPVSADRYRFSLVPWAKIGQVSWCTDMHLIGPRHQVLGSGEGCGWAASRRLAFIAGGFGGPVSYAIVDDRVAVLVAPDGRRLIPRRDPGLPSDWKYAIAFSGPTPTLAPGARPSMKPTGDDPYTWQALDSAGRPVGVSPLHANRDPRDFAHGQKSLLVAGGVAPVKASCAIQRRDGTPWSGHVVYRVLAGAAKAQPALNGRPYLGCAVVTIPARHDTVSAVVLVDARAPGARPAPLTALSAGIDGSDHPVARSPREAGVVGSHDLSMSAMRVGNAWLVVTGHSPASRAAFLRTLTVRTNLP